MNYTISAFVHAIADKLKPVYKDFSVCVSIAWQMFEAITQRSKATLIAQNYLLTPSEEKTLNNWVQRQVYEHVPLQYLIGTVPFFNVELFVEPPVLIPRPETEEWVANLLARLTKLPAVQLDILDLCTGSGCIALALAAALPQAQVIGVDISEQAVALAHKNQVRNAIKNARFLVSDLYSALAQMRFDLIVSNPPYISSEEWQYLEPRVKQWEDRRALVASDKGLSIIARIINKAHNYFKHPSILDNYAIERLMIEIGYNQGHAVLELAHNAGYKKSKILKDLQGHDRVLAVY